MFGQWESLGQEPNPHMPTGPGSWSVTATIPPGTLPPGYSDSGQPVGPGEMFPIPGSESPGGLNIIPGTPFGDCFLATHGTAEDEQNCIHQTTSSTSTSGTLFGSSFLRQLFGGGTAVRPAGSDAYSTVPDSAPATEGGFQLTNFGAVLLIGFMAFFLLKR